MSEPARPKPAPPSAVRIRRAVRQSMTIAPPAAPGRAPDVMTIAVILVLAIGVLGGIGWMMRPPAEEPAPGQRRPFHFRHAHRAAPPAALPRPSGRLNG